MGGCYGRWCAAACHTTTSITCFLPEWMGVGRKIGAVVLFFGFMYGDVPAGPLELLAGALLARPLACAGASIFLTPATIRSGLLLVRLALIYTFKFS